MAQEHLWRIGVLKEYEWYPPAKPFYIIAETKQGALKILKDRIVDPSRIGKVSRLGRACSQVMFRG